MPTTEERLAALETKLAALTETTPTTYYEHQYSGEEIDNAVARALPNGAIDQAAGTFVRPNLLDNWYFGRPVNQRGKSEYTGSGYTVDRWTAKEGVVSLSSGGLTLQNSTWLDQMIENLIENRIYTISLLTANGVLLTGTGLLNKDSFISVRIDGGGYTDISYHADVSRYYMELARADAAQPLSILAAKLELGPTQTLAHREGDKWVLNEVPDYGEQLRRCQRYYFTSNGLIGTSGCLTGGKGTINVDISLPVSMRTKPSVIGTPTVTGVRTVPNGTNAIAAITGAAVIGSSDCNSAISLALSTPTFNADTYINNTPLYCYISNLTLSADL